MSHAGHGHHADTRHLAGRVDVDHAVEEHGAEGEKHADIMNRKQFFQSVVFKKPISNKQKSQGQEDKAQYE